MSESGCYGCELELPASIMASNWIPILIAKALLFLESRENTFNLKEIYRIYSVLTKTHSCKPYFRVSETTGEAGSSSEK